MKIKISKASWMILTAGTFIIVLATLGVTRSGQVKEQNRLSGELTVAETRLDNIHATQLQPQIDELEEQLKDTVSQVEEAKERLKQTVLSVDVADKFYEIAQYCGVTISSVGISRVMKQTYANISCEATSLSAAITGTLSDITDFVGGLNNNFTTGFVQSVQLSIIGETEEGLTSASLAIIVYSYKGS
jgi:acetylglutamate synthase